MRNDSPSAPDNATVKQSFTQHPLVRMLLFFVLFIGLAAVLLVPLIVRNSGVSSNGTEATLFQTAYNSVALVLAALFAYIVLVRLFEKRKVVELSRNALALGLSGLFLGLVLFSAIVGLVWLVGGIAFHGTHTPQNWAATVFTAGLVAGIVEEIVFRGIVFRVVEDILGTYGSTISSAAVFGGLHIMNPNATIASSLAIALSAGVIFPALYALTRSLWICIGLHAAWNLSQALIFGIAVSGGESSGWLISEPTGADILSGGEFGVEASIITPVVLFLVAAAIFYRAWKSGKIVPPYWQRGVTFRGAARCRA